MGFGHVREELDFVEDGIDGVSVVELVGVELLLSFCDGMVGEVTIIVKEVLEDFGDGLVIEEHFVELN